MTMDVSKTGNEKRETRNEGKERRKEKQEQNKIMKRQPDPYDKVMKKKTKE